MSVLLEFSIFPTDQGESLSASVSEVIRLIDESGLPYQLTPMGTIVETDDFATALALVERSNALLESMGCQRIYGSIKFDIRKDKSDRMAGKIASVRARIGDVST
ncbi:MAG: MTH1187 family thiamine-binding protein [Chromatiales bacterium]|nr:MTH1187 family thiamine-binding protein [Gammaproteobacteria bacterium]MCP5352644.1 MTH1187 family thiamine-binding protein [Chromatiales bacterium]